MIHFSWFLTISLKPYTLTVLPSDHIRQHKSLLPFVPSWNKLLHLRRFIALAYHHQILVYHHVQLPFAVCSPLMHQDVHQCISVVDTSINSKCVLTVTYEQLKWKLNTANFKEMLSCSYTNIYSTYASQFQSGIVISCKWGLEWWLIDDIPFWIYFHRHLGIFYCLCAL